MNYKIHTDAIKEHIVPHLLTAKEIKFVYASEADILNMALFGMTAKQWREKNNGKKEIEYEPKNNFLFLCSFVV